MAPMPGQCLVCDSISLAPSKYFSDVIHCLRCKAIFYQGRWIEESEWQGELIIGHTSEQRTVGEGNARTLRQQ